MVNVFSDNYRFDFFLCHSPLFLNVLTFTTKGKRKKNSTLGTMALIVSFIYLFFCTALIH